MLVTGGGTGLGRAAAAELRACGAQVVVAGRREPVVAAAAAELGATHVAGDVREPADAKRMVRACLDRHGRLDVLVNNAGGQYFTPAEAITDKGWSTVTRLNLGGTELMSRMAAELAFRPQRGGTIINVTLSPHGGFPGMAHSSAARAAVEGLTQDARPRMGTGRDRGRRARRRPLRHGGDPKYPEQVWKAAARTVPLQRLGREQEHAWLVALVASPLGRALSGSVVTLDGARDNWSVRGRRRRSWGKGERSRRAAPRRGLTEHPFRGYHRARPVRAKCRGCTEAFQASRAGSIPVARSAGPHIGEWRIW